MRFHDTCATENRMESMRYAHDSPSLRVRAAVLRLIARRLLKICTHGLQRRHDRHIAATAVNANSFFAKNILYQRRLRMTLAIVMAGLVPAIHAFDIYKEARRGCPQQVRA